MSPGAVPSRRNQPVAHRRRILVVSGYAGVRQALSRTFAQLDCETATARDGEEAVSCLLETVKSDDSDNPSCGRFDLVIMDLILPRTSGLDLIRRLRDDFPPMPPTIVLGSLQESSAIRALLDLGACDYVSKPFDLDDLVDKAAALLGEPTPAPFHWAPLPGQIAFRIDGHRATATALSETGIVIELPVEATLQNRQLVAMESEFFDDGFDRWGHCFGRVMSVTRKGGQNILELAFVALSDWQLRRIRRFTVMR